MGEYISRVKTWIAGEILYASDLNSEFDNAIDSQIPEPSGSTHGDVIFMGASSWQRLAAGTSGYSLKTQGAGADPAWGAGAEVVDDTSPQLGGDLDLNGHNIDFPTTANVSDCLDEDDMATDSATMLATQQSIKAYVDTQIDTRSTRILVFPASCFETRVASGWAAFTQTQGTNYDYGQLDFDKDTDEKTYSPPFVMENYDGGNITIKIGWKANATTGNVMWVASFKGVADDEAWDDTMSDHAFAADGAGSTAYDLMVASLTVDPSELASDEATVMKITRDADNGSDTLAVDAQLVFVQIEYTRS